MYFVYGRNGAGKPIHDQRGEFETQVQPPGADMEEQISGSGNSVPNTRSNFAKRMEFRWTRRTKEEIPGVRPERHDAGQGTVEVAKVHGSYQCSEVAAKGLNHVEMVRSRIYFEHQKDRGGG